MNDLDITQAVSRVLSKYTKTTAPAPEQPAPAAATPLDRGSIGAIVASVLAKPGRSRSRSACRRERR